MEFHRPVPSGHEPRKHRQDDVRQQLGRRDAQGLPANLRRQLRAARVRHDGEEPRLRRVQQERVVHPRERRDSRGQCRRPRQEGGARQAGRRLSQDEPSEPSQQGQPHLHLRRLSAGRHAGEQRHLGTRRRVPAQD